MRGVDGRDGLGVSVAVEGGLLLVCAGQGLVSRSLPTLGLGTRIGDSAIGFQARGVHLSLQPLLDLEQLTETRVKRFVGRHVRHGEPPLRSLSGV